MMETLFKMVKIKLVFLTLMIMCVGVNAQNSLPFSLNYVPPSPNVSALGKFGDIPVGLSTGIPSITIPIYQYSATSKSLMHNVSIDYHAGGIKVEEIASNVGLGWALNASGAVSRTVRGLPDDLDTYGYLALGSNQIPYNTSNPNDVSISSAYTKNGYDGEQDVFSFSTPTEGGKFILDNQGNAVLIADRKVKIVTIKSSTPSSYPIKGFIITDESGIIYHFKDIEYTINQLSSLLPTLTYASSWHLTKIENPFTQDSVKFTYQNYNTLYDGFNSETIINKILQSNVVQQTSTETQVSSYSYSTLSKRISKISYPDYSEVNFYYRSVGRCDLSGDNGLQKIEINDLFSGSKRIFNLYQTYDGKTAYDPPPCNLSLPTPSTSLRLRLDSLVEQSGVIIKPGYVFYYDDSNPLPSRDSKKQDAWGFYNSNDSGTLVPLYITEDFLGVASYIPGADRRPDSTKVKSNSLIKIKYPTGGSIEFQYEVNRSGDGKLIDKILVTDKVNSTANFILTGSKMFVMDREVQTSPLTLNFNLTMWCPQVPTSCIYNFAVKDISNTITYASAAFTYAELRTTKPVTLPNFTNGNYNLTYSLSSGCTCDDMFQFNLSWQKIKTDDLQLAGGIRIKKIIQYDGQNRTNDVLRNFDYKLPNGKSSGTVGTPLKFTYQLRANYSNCGSWVGCPYLFRTATTNIPMAYTRGSPVAYSRVTETLTSATGSNGKEVSSFFSFKEWTDAYRITDFGSPPFLPPQVIDWAVGKLKKKEVFDSNGKLLNRQVNDYSVTEFEQTNYHNVKVGLHDLTFPNSAGSYNYSTYYWITGHCWNTYSRNTRSHLKNV
jgi:hypothetical protein